MELLKIGEVIALTKRSKAAIYRDARAGTFPRPVKVGASSFWIASEVSDWIANVIREAKGPA